MEILGTLFSTLFTNPTINGLVAIYKLLTMLHIPYALGFSIIVFTVIIRLILYPFAASQIKVSRKMQELQPHLSKLKDKHKGDAKRIQEETMLLYREHGVNPLGTCLPTLLQLFLSFALYRVFVDFLSTKSAETIAKFNHSLYFEALKLHDLASPTFFGLPLNFSPAKLLPTMGPAILLVPVITGVLQFLQSKMLFQSQPKVEKKKTDQPDFSSMMQTQMVYLVPFTIAFAAYSFPIGLALYWNTYTIFAMIQQYKLYGLGGLKDLKTMLGGKK